MGRFTSIPPIPLPVWWGPLGTLLLAGSAVAAYPTPEQAGFHHCVLLYDAETRTPAHLLPHVVHLDEAGEPDQWLFDAFLFCSQERGPSSGESYLHGPTNAADWKALLEGWWAPGYGYHALQKAVDQAEERLGPLPRPLQAVVTIPYPSPDQKGFGDLDGDGIWEDLRHPDGFDRAVSWYLDEVRGRFAKAAFPDIELWGFYWTWESVSDRDAANVKRTAERVHGRGYRLLWIPWFRAPGWNRWREWGFDVALMQPNYAFLSHHRGRIRNDRLVEAALLARTHGLGLEIETGYTPDTNPRVREILRDYLAFGAPDLCGYQHAATAYFQSFNIFPHLSQATDPEARRVYNEIAGYVRGQTVARPGHLTGATVRRDGEEVPELVDGRLVIDPQNRAGVVPMGGGETAFTVTLPRPRDVGELEVSVLQSPDSGWIGTIYAQAFRADDTEVSSGWRRAFIPPAGWGSFKTVEAVPLGAQDVQLLKVHYRPIASTSADDPQDRRCRNMPLHLPLPDGASGRWVRLRLEKLRGWTLLSEVEVR